jgi:hypothetical protein
MNEEEMVKKRMREENCLAQTTYCRELSAPATAPACSLDSKCISELFVPIRIIVATNSQPNDRRLVRPSGDAG